MELSDGRGLGAVVAEKFAAEGSNVAINYFSNVGRAKETAAKVEKDYGVKAIIIQLQGGKYHTVWPWDVATRDVLYPIPTWKDRK